MIVIMMVMVMMMMMMMMMIMMMIMMMMMMMVMMMIVIIYVYALLAYGNIPVQPRFRVKFLLKFKYENVVRLAFQKKFTRKRGWTGILPYVRRTYCAMNTKWFVNEITSYYCGSQRYLC